MPYYSPSNSSRQEERHGDLVQASVYNARDIIYEHDI